jgi:hypothetical protein
MKRMIARAQHHHNAANWTTYPAEESELRRLPPTAAIAGPTAIA